MVLQLRLVSGWGPMNRRSAPPYGPSGSEGLCLLFYFYRSSVRVRIRVRFGFIIRSLFQLHTQLAMCTASFCLLSLWWLIASHCVYCLLVVTEQFANKPTRGQSSFGLINSWTGWFMDKTICRNINSPHLSQKCNKKLGLAFTRSKCYFLKFNSAYWHEIVQFASWYV